MVAGVMATDCLCGVDHDIQNRILIRDKLFPLKFRFWEATFSDPTLPTIGSIAFSNRVTTPLIGSRQTVHAQTIIIFVFSNRKSDLSKPMVDEEESDSADQEQRT